MKIAVNQLLPIANDPVINFKTIEETVEQNEIGGALLSVFPEDFLYGVLRTRSDLMAAGKRFNEWVSKFQELAAKYEIDIVPGSFPQCKSGRIYNSAVYIDSSGRVDTTYSKHNLWLAEREEYSSGGHMPQVFNGVLGKTVIIICWDILDHHLLRSAVREGAEWIICLSFWSTNQSEDMILKRGGVNKSYWSYSDSLFSSDLIPTRSVEYNVGIVFVNFAKTHRYLGTKGACHYSRSAGRTQITTPRRQHFYTLNHHRPKTLLADIDVSESRKEMTDAEIVYGRREDILNNYPMGK